MNAGASEFTRRAATERPASSGSLAGPRTAIDRFIVVLCVFLSFAVYASVRAPLPGVNEPHYLTKARHFWDPQWCGGDRDVFLNSANAHLVFYATVGWLTSWLSFEAAAWTGRVLVWGLLAAAWTDLALVLLPARWAALWSAWIYLGLAAAGTISKEWMIGGVEAKAFGYAFLFWGLAALLRNRPLPAAAFVGLTISAHPVVGCWGLLAALCGWSWQCFRGQVERPSGGTLVAAACALIVCALPGLVPAAAFFVHVDPQAADYADRIQVFERLAHHLDPRRFSALAIAAYGILLGAWLALRRRVSWPACEPGFAAFVLATLAIALAGGVLGWTIRPHRLLKFYPFRLFDIVLPMAAAFTAAGWLTARAWPSATRWLLSGTAFVVALCLPLREQPADRLSPAERQAWLDVCRRIHDEYPARALFVTPRQNFAFKWYAQRAELASHKDCPQDAPSLVTWYRRIYRLRKIERGRPPFTRPVLEKLVRDFGVEYLVARWGEVPQGRPEYANDVFEVHRLPRELPPPGQSK